MPTPTDLGIARLVVARRFATEDQVARCLEDLRTSPLPRPLLDLLAERGLVTAGQAEVLREETTGDAREREDRELGQALTRQGFTTPGQIEECFEVIADLRRKGAATIPRLGQLLLSKGYVTEEEINRILSMDDEEPGATVSTPGPVVPDAAPAFPAPSAGRQDRSFAAPEDRGPARPPPAPGPFRIPPPPPEPVRRREPAPASSRPVCVYCGLAMHEEAARVPCPDCGGIQHADCWEKSAGCARAACRERRTQAGRAAIDRSVSARRRRLGIRLGAVAGLALLVTGAVIFALHVVRDARWHYRRGLEAAGVDPATRRPWRAADFLPAGADPDPSLPTPPSAEEVRRGERSMQHFHAAVRRDPACADAWFEIGRIEFARGNGRGCAEAMRKVLELQPAAVPALLFLGGAALRRADPIDAEHWFGKAVEADPGNVEAHELLAVLLDGDPRRRAESEREWRAVVHARPQDAVAAGRLVQVLIDQGKYADALDVLEQVERRSPGATALAAKRALLHFKQGAWEQALALIEPQVAARADDFDARRIQAICLHRLGRAGEALVAARAALTGSTDPELAALAGELAIRLGEPQEGIALLRQSLQRERKPEVLEKLGDTLLVLHQFEEARATFEDLRSVNSSHPRVNFRIGCAAAQLDDSRKARAALKELRALEPDNPELAALEAQVLGRDGDAAGAIAALRGILSRHPDCAFARRRLGVSLRDAGDPIGALQEFRAALAGHADPETRFEMAQAYLTLKKESAAHALLREFLEAVPFGPSAERARDLLSATAGGPESDRFAAVIRQGAEPVRKLTTRVLAHTGPWEYVTAALHAAGAHAWVLAGDLPRSSAGIASTQSAVDRLGTDPGARRVDAEAVELDRAVSAWSTLYPGLVESLGIVIERRDPARACAAELERIREDLTEGTAAESAVEARVETQARALTRSLELLVKAVVDSDSARGRLEEVRRLHRAQIRVCANPLQRICAESYASARIAEILLSALDRRKTQEDRRAEAMRRFEAREAQARTVLEQLRNGTTTLCDLLAALAADPALRP